MTLKTAPPDVKAQAATTPPATPAAQVTPKAAVVTPEGKAAPADKAAAELLDLSKTAPAAPAAAAAPAKPDSPEAGEKKLPEGQEPAKETPPAEVTYDLALAEDSALDPEVDVPAVLEFAKAEKISPDLAKKVLLQREDAIKSWKVHQQAQTKAIVEGWAKELPTDQEIGGDKLPGALEDAKRALARFGDDEMRKVLEQTGLGNNRIWLRMAARVGKTLRDEVLVDGKESGAGGAGKSAAEVLFPLEEIGRTQDPGPPT